MGPSSRVAPRSHPSRRVRGVGVNFKSPDNRRSRHTNDMQRYRDNTVRPLGVQHCESHCGYFTSLTGDVILGVLAFLPVGDLVNATALCQQFLVHANDELIWEELCITRMEAIMADNVFDPSGCTGYGWDTDAPKWQVLEHVPKSARSFVMLARKNLLLGSYQLVFSILRWLSLVGTWRRIPQDIRTEFRGELLALRFRGPHLVGEVVQPDRSRQPKLSASFKVSPTNRRQVEVMIKEQVVQDPFDHSSNQRIPHRLRIHHQVCDCGVATRRITIEAFCPPNENSQILQAIVNGDYTRVVSPRAHLQAADIKTENENSLECAIAAGCVLVTDDMGLQPLKIGSTLSYNDDIGTPLRQLEGLWVAPYGSHGLEIVCLSHAEQRVPFHRCIDESAKDGKNCPIGLPRLEGLKVVGDANVPASKLSFVVDSSQQFDPSERLAMDHRLVVAFPPEGAVIADLMLRKHNITAWYRGMGQINRIQGEWAPEWVGIDFLVYNGSSPTGFSVLWDEQGEVIRHVIDFIKLGID